MNEIKASLVSRECVSPEDFVKIMESDRENIKKLAIVPPQLGVSGFGCIEVTYNIPIYAVRGKRKLSKNGKRRRTFSRF